MTTIQLSRVFLLKKGSEETRIADPNPNYSTAEVADFLGEHYPELINAQFAHPRIEGNELIYEVSKSFGTKG